MHAADAIVTLFFSSGATPQRQLYSTCLLVALHILFFAWVNAKKSRK